MPNTLKKKKKEKEKLHKEPFDAVSTHGTDLTATRYHFINYHIKEVFYSRTIEYVKCKERFTTRGFDVS